MAEIDSLLVHLSPSFTSQTANSPSSDVVDRRCGSLPEEDSFRDQRRLLPPSSVLPPH